MLIRARKKSAKLLLSKLQVHLKVSWVLILLLLFSFEGEAFFFTNSQNLSVIYVSICVTTYLPTNLPVFVLELIRTVFPSPLSCF